MTTIQKYQYLVDNTRDKKEMTAFSGLSPGNDINYWTNRILTELECSILVSEVEKGAFDKIRGNHSSRFRT